MTHPNPDVQDTLLMVDKLLSSRQCIVRDRKTKNEWKIIAIRVLADKVTFDVEMEKTSEVAK